MAIEVESQCDTSAGSIRSSVARKKVACPEISRPSRAQRLITLIFAPLMTHNLAQLKSPMFANLFAKIKSVFGFKTPCDARPDNGLARDPELEAMLQEHRELIKQSFAQSLVDAHQAAKEGVGPQPWDQDWLENQTPMEDEIEHLSRSWSWQTVNNMIEVLNWASASPQGQRAVALSEDDDNPWQGPLDLIEEMKRALMNRSHSLLFQQAKGLEYPGTWLRDLADALEEVDLAREEA